MPISVEEVLKIAGLARLELNEEEVQRLTKELSQILDFFKQLQEVPTENVKPTFHSLEVETPFREDEVREFEEREAILKNAPELDEKGIVVPKVVKT